MAVAALAGGGSGNSGALAADNVFFVQSGKIHLSSDAGTTKVPFDAGEKVIFKSGLTVHWFNDQPTAAELRYMAL
jgi:uncharacterized cupin superfamily protein